MTVARDEAFTGTSVFESIMKIGQADDEFDDSQRHIHVQTSFLAVCKLKKKEKVSHEASRLNGEFAMNTT